MIGYEYVETNPFPKEEPDREELLIGIFFPGGGFWEKQRFRFFTGPVG